MNALKGSSLKARDRHSDQSGGGRQIKHGQGICEYRRLSGRDQPALADGNRETTLAGAEMVEASGRGPTELGFMP
ncbi:hypothetical protein SAY86_023310 [Trapa natans]|uniref:Uncharacterized protein n=1 Tax=Trapa natans TaxID=22666 RepID=A0AAN7R983_TRANT|nr:hypothetical protein SAY86_023310 [Trapa natans]